MARDIIDIFSKIALSYEQSGLLKLEVIIFIPLPLSCNILNPNFSISECPD